MLISTKIHDVILDWAAFHGSGRKAVSLSDLTKRSRTMRLEVLSGSSSLPFGIRFDTLMKQNLLIISSFIFIVLKIL